MKKYFPSLLQISLKIIIVQAPTIPHFKGLGMRNLPYEMRICQKIIIISLKDSLCMVFIFIDQMLFQFESSLKIVTKLHMML